MIKKNSIKLPKQNEDGTYTLYKNEAGRPFPVRVYVAKDINKAFSKVSQNARRCDIFDLSELYATKEEAIDNRGKLQKTKVWYIEAYGDKICEGFTVIRDAEQKLYDKDGTPPRYRIDVEKIFKTKAEAFKFIVERKKKELEQEVLSMKKAEKSYIDAVKALTRVSNFKKKS